MNALVACYRAYRAWCGTQPQLTIPGFDGLDEPQPSALRFVEPVGTHPIPPGRGARLAADVPSRRRARLNTNGPVRNSPEELRGRGQNGA